MRTCETIAFSHQFVDIHPIVEATKVINKCTVHRASIIRNADVDAADGLGAADELDALALGLAGQGSGVCAGGLDFDV